MPRPERKKSTDPRSRDAHEAHAHQDSRDRHLVVTKLDPLEVLHREGPRRDETVEREDFVHLNRRDERAPSLSDNVDD